MSREGDVEFEEELQFDIQISNIPRMARLCFAIYEMSKTAKGVKARKMKEVKQVCEGVTIVSSRGRGGGGVRIVCNFSFLLHFYIIQLN